MTEHNLPAVKSSRAPRNDGGRTPSGSSTLPTAVTLHEWGIRLRALRRKLGTNCKHAQKLIDQELERMVA